jgi:CheY-like chemotaxis protein
MILDFAMPGINGVAVGQQFRERLPDLPIIFASGYRKAQPSARSRKNGPGSCTNRSRSGTLNGDQRTAAEVIARLPSDSASDPILPALRFSIFEPRKPTTKDPSLLLSRRRRLAFDDALLAFLGQASQAAHVEWENEESVLQPGSQKIRTRPKHSSARRQIGGKVCLLKDLPNEDVFVTCIRFKEHMISSDNVLAFPRSNRLIPPTQNAMWPLQPVIGLMQLSAALTEAMVRAALLGSLASLDLCGQSLRLLLDEMRRSIERPLV